jgi:hypothetical protein
MKWPWQRYRSPTLDEIFRDPTAADLKGLDEDELADFAGKGSFGSRRWFMAQAERNRRDQRLPNFIQGSILVVLFITFLVATYVAFWAR